MARADQFTSEKIKPIYYSDFLINFDKNPLTGNLGRVTNEESIKQSIKNLILVDRGEYFYDMNKGSKLRSTLFDLMSDSQETLIKDTIKEAIRNYEPRAKDVKVEVITGNNDNELGVTITFTTINIAQTVSMNIIIKKVR